MACKESVCVLTPVLNRQFSISANHHFLVALTALAMRSRAKWEVTPLLAVVSQGRACWLLGVRGNSIPCCCLCCSTRRTSALKAVGHLPTVLNLLNSEKKEEASDLRAGLPAATYLFWVERGLHVCAVLYLARTGTALNSFSLVSKCFTSAGID